MVLLRMTAFFIFFNSILSSFGLYLIHFPHILYLLQEKEEKNRFPFKASSIHSGISNICKLASHFTTKVSKLSIVKTQKFAQKKYPGPLCVNFYEVGTFHEVQYYPLCRCRYVQENNCNLASYVYTRCFLEFMQKM